MEEQHTTPVRSGDEIIQAAIDLAAKEGRHTVTIPGVCPDTENGVWEIRNAILLPSDMTLVLDGSHLRMADGVISNMFRNANAHTPLGRTPAGRQYRIRLLGKNGAVLDGGKPNALNEQTSGQNGLPHVSENLLLYFHNVEDFTVSGFTVLNQRWWSMAFMYARTGRIADLHFRLTRHAEDTCGVWRNQDGVDLRVGCSNIVIENLEGETGDDFIALTALWSPKFEQKEQIPAFDRDIHDVEIRSVRAVTNMCALVRLLCHFHQKIYNIRISGLFEICRPGIESRSQMALRIGDDALPYYRSPENHVTPGDMFNITVEDVYSHSLCLLNVCGAVRNLTARGLHVLEDGGYACFFGFAGADNVFLFHPSRREEYEKIRFHPVKAAYPAILENFVIDGVFCDGSRAEAAIGVANAELRNVAVHNLFRADSLPTVRYFDDSEKALTVD